MNLIRCDVCDKEVKEWVHWYRVELEGSVKYKWENPELQICSASCVADYFKEEAEKFKEWAQGGQ